MLQKGFFLTEPFNPNPYWDNTFVNLVGGQKYENDTVFPIGRYRVVVQSGGSRYTVNNTDTDVVGALINKDIVIRRPFIIRAYCGEYSWLKWTNGGNTETHKIGINPYSGSFKVNGINNVDITPSYKNNIFGNAGSCSYTGGNSNLISVSSGNCLGDGVLDNYTKNSISGAGSCLHIIPVGGEFGTNYLYAFHTTGGAGHRGASGGAYGGGASGGIFGFVNQYTTLNTKNGGKTPYGNGGAGVSCSGASGKFEVISGNNGSGIGHGWSTKGTFSNLPVFTQLPHGAAAFFNGSSWESVTTLPNSWQDGKITITYLGTIN